MKTYRVLLIFTVLATLGGILTMIPRESASYPNILGYRSLCTFAPSATFFCFLAAGLSCFIRAAFIRESSGSIGKKIRKHGKSFIPLSLVAAIALGFTVWFVSIKAEYRNPDTASAASEWNDE